MMEGPRRALYTRYGVPDLWFVDPIARVSGEQAVDLPPFTDLGLVPASLCPDGQDASNEATVWRP